MTPEPTPAAGSEGPMPERLMPEPLTRDPLMLEPLMRRMAHDERAALDAGDFLARVRRAADRTRPDTRPAVDLSPWMAAPLGVALALAVWLAASLLGSAHAEWAAAVEAWDAPRAVVEAALAFQADGSGHALHALMNQLAGLVLCAWCSWMTWQLRRFTP